MPDVHGDLGPPVEAQRATAGGGADLQQLVHREDVTPAGFAPTDPVELAQLLERVDPHVRVGADAELDVALQDALDRKKPVTEVRLRRRARARSEERRV